MLNISPHLSSHPALTIQSCAASCSPQARKLWQLQPGELSLALAVIDGTGLFHRCYHASSGDQLGYTTPDGEPTTALVAFARLLTDMIARGALPPSTVIAFDDTAAPCWRRQRWPIYKANRPPKPADLTVQLARAPSIAEAMGFRVVVSPANEADDVLFTLARQSARDLPDRYVFLLTRDRDLYQAIGERCWLHSGDISETADSEDVYTSPAVVAETFGFTDRERLLDVRCLAGDTSDGLKGVPGIGEKIAIQLITEFGSLDALYERIYHGHAEPPDDGTPAATKTALTKRREALLVDHQKAAREGREIMRLRDLLDPADAKDLAPFGVRPLSLSAIDWPYCGRRVPDPATLQTIAFALGSSGLASTWGLVANPDGAGMMPDLWNPWATQTATPAASATTKLQPEPPKALLPGTKELFDEIQAIDDRQKAHDSAISAVNSALDAFMATVSPPFSPELGEDDGFDDLFSTPPSPPAPAQAPQAPAPVQTAPAALAEPAVDDDDGLGDLFSAPPSAPQSQPNALSGLMDAAKATESAFLASAFATIGGTVVSVEPQSPPPASDDGLDALFFDSLSSFDPTAEPPKPAPDAISPFATQAQVDEWRARRVDIPETKPDHSTLLDKASRLMLYAELFHTMDRDVFDVICVGDEPDAEGNVKYVMVRLKADRTVLKTVFKHDDEKKDVKAQAARIRNYCISRQVYAPQEGNQ